MNWIDVKPKLANRSDIEHLEKIRQFLARCGHYRNNSLRGAKGEGMKKIQNAYPVLAWWSAGITSTVACKLALKMYKKVRLIYIETGSAHKDNARFKEQCEDWYNQNIETWQSKKYDSVSDVIITTRYVNGAGGARCTNELKKEVRQKVERSTRFEHQVFGYEYERKQINRALRFIDKYPYTKPLFPLIENKLTKNECAGIIESAGIKLPVMYELGYQNNNCIGCVKGGKGYWNKIRVDFPEAFDKMAKDEREVGASCIKGVFLDELDPSEGRMTDTIIPECGAFCQSEFADIEDERTEKIITGEISISQLTMF